MAQEKILLVEDEKDLADPLKEGLCEEGFQVEIAATGQIAIHKLAEHWDLVILDLMLPDMPGESIVHYLRQKPDYPPILILTARSSLEDKVTLFRQGCDDYLTKPVIFEELVGHVRALLRRSHRVTVDKLSYEDISLDPQTFILSSNSKSVLLTPKEAALMRFFLTNSNRVISRKELIQNIWGTKEEPETDFFAVHLSKLRKKLSEINREIWLRTIRGSGVLFSKDGDHE